MTGDPRDMQNPNLNGATKHREQAFCSMRGRAWGRGLYYEDGAALSCLRSPSLLAFSLRIVSRCVSSGLPLPEGAPPGSARGPVVVSEPTAELERRRALASSVSAVRTSPTPASTGLALAGGASAFFKAPASGLRGRQSRSSRALEIRRGPVGPGEISGGGACAS